MGGLGSKASAVPGSGLVADVDKAQVEVHEMIYQKGVIDGREEVLKQFESQRKEWSLEKQKIMRAKVSEMLALEDKHTDAVSASGRDAAARARTELEAAAARHLVFRELRERDPAAVPTRDISVMWHADLLRPSTGAMIAGHEEEENAVSWYRYLRSTPPPRLSEAMRHIRKH